ncbi:MAG: hypothetical protein HY000_32890, partial [Planctomycetes bacterium]|nr:hypothetical protein [Planctomycetota bacterium]
MKSGLILLAVFPCFVPGPTSASEVKLQTRKHDPYESPRPAPGQENVPLRSSFHVQLAVGGGDAADFILPESVTIELQPGGRE